MRIDDPKVMRALAHPARLAVLRRLHGGPATATECAEVTGLSPSATSYHLRALAEYGLVEKAPSRGDGRENVWRARDTQLALQPQTAEGRAASKHLLQSWLATQDKRLWDWIDQEHEQPAEWQDAVIVHQLAVTITPEQLPQVMARLEEVLAEYRESPDPEARRVSVTIRTTPYL